MRAKHILRSFTIGILTTTSLFAQSGRSDYDIDNDGLIEINNLNDLNAIRNDAVTNNINLYGSTQGCPSNGCVGYELTTDLDFDTNRNGRIDSGDSFWNEGQGWLPLTPFIFFENIFEGNNHEIRNLMINRPGKTFVGLFETMSLTTIRNLSITGPLTNIVGDRTVGSLVGDIPATSTIDNVHFSGTVTGDRGVGGLIGDMGPTSIIKNSSVSGTILGNRTVGGMVGTSVGVTYSNSFVTANVSGSSRVGGLIGSNPLNATINACFTTGEITGESSVGGFIGFSYKGTITASFTTAEINGEIRVGGLIGQSLSTNASANYVIGRITADSHAGALFGSVNETHSTSNYWATNTTGQNNDNGEFRDFTTEGGYTLAQLRCPTSSTNTSCVTDRLFDGWETYVDGNGIPLWEFGSNSQLPGLRINDRVYRDNNYDGTVESSTAPNRTVDSELTATHNYTNSSRYCGWSTPQATDDENITESTLRCIFGSQRVATRYDHSDGSCEIDMHHNDYELTLISEGSCHYGIYYRPAPTNNPYPGYPPTPPSSSSSSSSTTTLAYKAPGASGATTAPGCSWNLNYRNYGSTSYDLYCGSTRYAELLIYDSNNRAGSPYSCEVRIHRSGTTGGGNYGYGQAGNIEACTPTIRGTR